MHLAKDLCPAFASHFLFPDFGIATSCSFANIGTGWGCANDLPELLIPSCR
jgi:hypothetical protein